MRPSKSEMSKPTSSSVLTSGRTSGLPAPDCRSATDPIGPSPTRYRVTRAKVLGWRPDEPYAPRTRSELTASTFQNASSEMVQVADSFG
jgi:hypothetical protein